MRLNHFYLNCHAYANLLLLMNFIYICSEFHHHFISFLFFSTPFLLFLKLGHGAESQSFFFWKKNYIYIFWPLSKFLSMLDLADSFAWTIFFGFTYLLITWWLQNWKSSRVFMIFNESKWKCLCASMFDHGWCLIYNNTLRMGALMVHDFENGSLMHPWF